MPIHLAAEKDHAEVVKFFCDKENFPDQLAMSESENDYDRTPLHLAVIGKSLNSAKYLLKAGSNNLVDNIDKNGVSMYPSKLFQAWKIWWNGIVKSIILHNTKLSQ